MSAPTPQPSLAALAALVLVRLYQRALSPLFPSTCRYYPSCSEYAARALAGLPGRQRRRGRAGDRPPDIR